MEPPFIVPVETVLEVDEKEYFVGDNQIDKQCHNWKVETPQSKSCNL